MVKKVQIAMIIPVKYIFLEVSGERMSDLDRRDVHQSVDNGIDGEACRTVNL